MRIAQVSPLYEAVPPRFYGGTERVVAHLTDALVDLGHEVTLFASAEARTKARLVPVRNEAIRLDPSPLKSDLAAHMNALAQVRDRAADFDLIHFHTDMIHFPFFGDMAHRTLTTLHGRLDLKDLAGVYARWRDFPLVSISDHQRLPLPEANWAGTVHHGMDANLYRFHPEPGGYLAFLGRISPEKRPDRAIEIAVSAGVPLRIAAKVDQADRDYYASRIKPQMDHPLVTFVGEIGDGEKSDFLGGAQALLFPIDWPEPFGLVMIEAMACGVPVIAYDCGSVPEVVEPGLTGLIVRNQTQAAAAVAATAGYDRAKIRARFETRFSARAMAQRYLDLHAALGVSSGGAPGPLGFPLAVSA
ncbi:MAG: glycosyltransferase family 4 protein [Phenylobacterium sp.]|uniref:glycosyltransferase family 4 protein n=1 Tax=Phenylobacterium sp. TaxID=1871053 RepID=UPI00271E0592|nr:glycosyltransferase family 4 protein [Phenylobacterium sp.]MDO8901093.1 glycosyltransferase family 4 protein [Phenylobacterium sp.]